MSKNLSREQIADHANVIEASGSDYRAPTEIIRNFELPKGLYMTTALCYLAFLGILATAFASPGLVLPMAACIFFLFVFFGISAIWTRMAPESRKEPMNWGQLRRRGIATNVGHLSGGEAAIQMLLLPVLIVMWALAVVTIAALI